MVFPLKNMQYTAIIMVEMTMSKMEPRISIVSPASSTGVFLPVASSPEPVGSYGIGGGAMVFGPPSLGVGKFCFSGTLSDSS